MGKAVVLLLVLYIHLFALYDSDSSPVDILYFHDCNRTYDIVRVIDQADRLFRKHLQSNNAKFSPNATVWMKIKINNISDLKSEKVLKFLDIRLDQMDIYSKEGRFIYSIGDRVPYSSRSYNDAQIAIDINAAAHSRNVIYIKFSNENQSDLTYQFFEKELYEKDLIFKKGMHAFFFGALLIMLVYNFVLYLFIRERAFLTYIIYHTVVLIVMLYHTGFMVQFWHPDAYDVNAGNVPTFLIYLSIILVMLFLENFLHIRIHTPRLDKFLYLLIYLNTLLLMLDLFNITPVYLPILIAVPISVLVLFIASYYTFVLKSRLALFYLSGWLTMLVASIVTGLTSYGVVERNDFTAYIFQTGIMIEIALLSMGLAYRYKVNQDKLAEKSRVIHEQAKLASMGEMLRHIAHQWRQPLSEINSVAMKIETDHRRNTLDERSLDKNIEQIENITEHMSQTIRDFNGYFKSDKEKTRVILEEVVDKALDLVLSGLTRSDIKVEKIVESREEVDIVEGELIQVLLVLLNNARDALKTDGAREQWIKIRITKEGSKNLIEIEDSGGGIENADLEKVFEPYFTTKFESQGVGIGLYMAKMIVEESLGGRLSVSNGTDGAKFALVF